MTSDTRSPEEIEREIERERAGLSNTLNDLQDRFSVDTIARQVMGQFREHGGDVGRSLTEAVKRNPVALGLTGVGLAWLMLGDRSGPAAYDRRYPERGYDDDSDGRYGAGSRSGRAYGAGSMSALSGGSEPRGYSQQPSGTAASRYGQDNVPSWARNASEDRSGNGSTSMPGAAASSAAEAARHAGSSLADRGKEAAGAVSDAGRSAMAGARHLASDASDRASALRERLAEGTETLSEDARARVIAARERAMEARDSAMEYGRMGRDRAADMYEAQPLIAGALALALGAAIGAALPHSRVEDDYLGDYSDDLMDEAERIFAEEKDKLSKVAMAATDEAKRALNEAKQEADAAAPAETAAQAAVDKAKGFGERVAGAAEDEARKQRLGDIDRS